MTTATQLKLALQTLEELEKQGSVSEEAETKACAHLRENNAWALANAIESAYAAWRKKQ